MKRSGLTLSIAVLLALLAPSRAGAAGVITGLAASANPVAVNTDVTFTVKGTSGGCGEVILDYGDGQSSTLTSVSFSNNTNTTSPPHRYAGARTYAVKANPGKGCTGSAMVSLVVGGAAGGGSAIRALGGVKVATGTRHIAAAMAPRIDNVFPLSVISPGGAVIVMGRNFGNAPGRLHLKLRSGEETSLGRLTWADNSVSGTIDPNLGGVLDQPATLQVTLPDGWASNEVPVTFTARREIRMIPFADFQCSTEDKGGLDQCNSHFGDVGSFSLFGIHGCTGFFDVWSGCWASGVDAFWTTLANGWRIHDTVLTNRITGSRGGEVQTPPTIQQQGPGPVRITVWWDSGVYQIQYSYQVYAEGPAGTSYK